VGDAVTADDGAASATVARRGDPDGTGTAQANCRAAGERSGPDAFVAPPGSRAATRLAPVVETRSPSSSSSTVTEPSWSVRYTRAPLARRRARVDGAGCPYVLPAPADAIATFGLTASTNAWVVAVRLP
jgi:hypothetical protein